MDILSLDHVPQLIKACFFFILISLFSSDWIIPRDLSWSPQFLLSLHVEAITFFISCILYSRISWFFKWFLFVEFLILFMDYSWVHWLVCVLSYITQLLSNHYFQFFFFFSSLLTDLHLLGVSYWSSTALFWWCHISFIFLMGLFWCLCLWGEVTSSGLFRLASVGKTFPLEVAVRALAGWDAVSSVPEEAQWFSLHATPLADLGQNRGSFMPKATEDRQQMGLLVSSESEVALCLYGEV